MKQTRISIAIMWIIWAKLESKDTAVAAAAANSGERVHIRLHMPEVVRQHTHFHKVYKPLPIPVPYQHPTHHQRPPHHHHHHSQLMPVGKPHVSLLGYTTTASGSGGMSPSLMQLMATAATPTMTPNYGPALFNSYTQDEQPEEEDKGAMKTSGSSSSSYLGTAPGSSSMNKQQQQQMLQQLFTPNLMAAIKAAQLLDRAKEEQKDQELDTEMDEPQTELELEHNELLNGNFLAALQREYVSKFVKPGRSKRKKKINRAQKQTNYVQQHYDDADDDYHEPGTGYAQLMEDEPYSDPVQSYDSAMAFSGQNNELTSVPSVDEFLKEVNNGKTYAPFYGNMYDDYEEPTGGSNTWQALNPQPRPTKAPNTRLMRKRRPLADMVTGYGSTGSSGNPGKVRYIKLTTRKKRKNRIKTKRYRI